MDGWMKLGVTVCLLLALAGLTHLHTYIPTHYPWYIVMFSDFYSNQPVIDVLSIDGHSIGAHPPPYASTTTAATPPHQTDWPEWRADHENGRTDACNSN